MVAAGTGIVGNQVVARYKRAVGRRIQSATLTADAQHSWLDAVSSAGALLGLLGVAAGLSWADALAGLFVTVFIAHVGWEVTTDLLNHLMDGVEPEVLAEAVSAAEAVPGVAHAHARARWMGRTLIVEVEGFLNPETSLRTGDEMGGAVRTAVAGAVPQSRSVVWIPRSMPSGPSGPSGTQ
jgi:cation diffusion facilitator family transporter